MDVQELTQDEIRSVGLEVLARELGATGLVRFLQIYEHGDGDYTRERETVLPRQTAQQIAEKIRQTRKG